MSGGVGQQQNNGMQQIYYDPKTNQYMVPESRSGNPFIANNLPPKYVPFEGNGLPNLNPSNSPPKVNFNHSQLLQSQLANAQAMFNSPLAIPQTRTAPKPTIGGKK
jgi:hypothetical protein